MAIEVSVRNPGLPTPSVAEVALPPGEAVLPRNARINLTLRRRRRRRLQQAVGTAAWVVGAGALLFFAAAGVLSLH